MKRIGLMGLVACAASLTAFANTTNAWFSGAASGAEKTNINSTWTTPASGVTVSNSVITLDNDLDTKLSLAPDGTATDATSDGLIVITFEAELTVADKSDLPTIVEGAKTGFALAVDGTATNYCAYANGSWTNLVGGAEPKHGTKAVKIVMDTRVQTATFFVDGALLTISNTEGATALPLGASATSLTAIDCFGTGKLTSLSAAYEVAMAAVVNQSTTVKYGSVAEALSAVGKGRQVTLVNEDGSVLSSEETNAANGLPRWQCVAMGIATNDANAKIQLTPPAGADTTENGIKLQFAGTLQPGITAKFKVRTNGGDPAATEYPSDAIVIPLATGKYTLVPVLSATAQ